jgi:integrase
MPYSLQPPKAGRSPYWRVRGTQFGNAIDRSTKTADKREAAKFLALWREEAKRASLSGAAKAAPTFGDAVLSYIQAGRSKLFLQPLVEHFGEKPLSEIGQAEVDGAAAILYPKALPQTRNRCVYTPIIAIMRHVKAPVAITRPKWKWTDGHRIAWLKPEEAFRLLDAAYRVDQRLGALMTFLLYCGPRLSETLRLDWADVDLASATPTALLRRTKNGKPIGLHLPPDVVAALANLEWKTGRVFRLSKSGRLYALLAKAEKAAGLILPPGSVFHILRHTHATWRRRYTIADTAALVETGLWQSRNGAAVYEHFEVSEEARKADQLPTRTRAKKG